MQRRPPLCRGDPPPLQRRPRAWRARWSVVETVLLWGFRKGISRNFRNAEIACKLKGNCATLRFCDTTLSERIKIWRAVRATNAAVYGGSRFEARFRSAVISLRGEIGIPTVAPPSLLLFVLIWATPGIFALGVFAARARRGVQVVVQFVNQDKNPAPGAK